jgi:hypothetical protein
MNILALNLDNSPPLRLPFLFFNTGPWMAVLAAMFLFSGEQVFLFQKTPDLLAITHLFTLGFMAMTMIGALFQVLPVLFGKGIPGKLWLAPGVHLLLTIGILLLATGFAFSAHWLFSYAIPLLFIAFMSFIISVATVVYRPMPSSQSATAIRLAVISLILTLILGAGRATAYAYPGIELGQFFNASAHMLWGLTGWLLLLVMGVSFQVIPMFHVTPNFPGKFCQYLPIGIFSCLVLLAFHLQPLVICCLAIFISIYAGYAIWLLSKRKRKVPDNTVYFWRLALINLILALLLVLIRYADQAWQLNLLSHYWQQMNISIGLLVIVGFGCSVVIGMLQKIIPFLIYMQLQRQCGHDFEKLQLVPTMHTIISSKQSRWQFQLHLVSLIFLVATVFLPPLKNFTAIVLASNFTWLGITLARATRLYIKTHAKLSLDI